MTTPADLVFLEHNFDQPVRRTLAWRTDIMLARRGSEQRRKIRTAPLETMAYSVTLLTQEDAAEFAWMVWSAVDLRIAFPRWEDVLLASAPIMAGDTVIALERPVGSRRFVQDIVLYWDGRLYERLALDPLAINPEGMLTLAVPAARQWPAGTRIIPVITGNVTSPISGDDFSNLIGTFTLEITLEEDIAGVTGGGDAVPMEPASIVIRPHGEGSERGGIPYDDIQGIVIDVFDAAGRIIPDADVTVTSGPKVEVYFSGMSSVWNVRNIRTDGLTAPVFEEIAVASGGITEETAVLIV